MHWDGCAITAEQFNKIMRVDRLEWQRELELQGTWLDGLGRRVPLSLVFNHDSLEGAYHDRKGVTGARMRLGAEDD